MAAALDQMVDRPGKFEGCRQAVVVAYGHYLDGFADDDGEVVTVVIDRPDLGDGATETVSFIEDDQGFITEVTG